MRVDAKNTSVLWNTTFGKHLVISSKAEYLHNLQASKNIAVLFITAIRNVGLSTEKVCRTSKESGIQSHNGILRGSENEKLLPHAT